MAFNQSESPGTLCIKSFLQLSDTDSEYLSLQKNLYFGSKREIFLHVRYFSEVNKLDCPTIVALLDGTLIKTSSIHHHK
jgi:hypothetical protein